MRKRIGRFFLRLRGWRVLGELPPEPKMVIIGGPHTSNWDFPLAMFAAPALGIKIKWLGKHTLFRKPFGWFFRMLGGIPVDRSAAHGVVGETVELFRSTDRLVLVITPEGTRKKTDGWKSGFWHIASRAGVPLLLIGVSGERKEIEVGPLLNLSGDVRADMDQVRDFYKDYGGVKPQNVSEIRLREESG